MDRSLYPEGTEVHQDDLERTETDRAFHILQRQVDSNILGVKSGYSVSLNVDATLINIAAGTGYAPNGEYVELTTAQAAVGGVGLPLSDYTLNVVNFVLAVYTETNDELEPHETNGSSFPTAANRSVRLRVLTQAEFDALPATDENLNNDAVDRALILAQVTAQGIAVNLVSGNIVNATTFPGAVSAVFAGAGISGVTISSIDRTTPAGIGILDYTSAGTLLTWQAPGDTVGASVNIGISGTYIITSANGKTITIVSSSGQLGADDTDNVTISNIYNQTVNRYSPEDLQHRSLLGGSSPTANNPHGLNITDILGASFIDDHQDLFHSNGILRNSAANALLASIDTGPTTDELDVVAPISGDSFYLNGIEHNALAGIVVDFSGLGGDVHAIYDIYVVEGASGVATLERVERLRYRNANPPPAMGDTGTGGSVQLRGASRNISAGDGTIKFNNTPNTLEFTAPGDGSPGTAVAVPASVATAVRLFNVDDTKYIDVFVNDLPSFGIDGGDVTEIIDFADLPNATQLESRLRIATVLFSGSATGYLGNGFASATNGPNTLVDHRLFGTLGPDDVRDDLGDWIRGVDTNPNESYANITLRKVGVGKLFPDAGTQLDVKNITAGGAGITGEGGVEGTGIVGRGGAGSTDGIGVEGIGTGAGADAFGVKGVAGSDASAGVLGESEGAGTGLRGTSATGSGIVGLSLGTVATILGNNFSSGPGIEGVSLSGHGGRFSGNAISSPLAIETLATAPSTNAKGDVYAHADTGRIEVANGDAFERVVDQIYADADLTTVDQKVSATGEFIKKFSIPANSLRQGSVIRIKAGGRANTTGAFIMELRMDTDNIDVLSTSLTANRDFLFNWTLFVEDFDGGTNFRLRGAGYNVGDTTFTAGAVMGLEAISKAFAAAHEININLSSNAATLSLMLLSIDIT